MAEASSKIEIGGDTSSTNNRHMKFISLVTLTFQKALLGLSMRYSRTRSGDMFFAGTAVLMAEVVKLVTCLFLVYRSPNEGGSDVKKLCAILHKHIIANPFCNPPLCPTQALFRYPSW